jgi:anti-sigma factor RsiW
VSSCQLPFEENLLSGYIDGVLSQGEEQRVRLHLEDCQSCSSLIEEMKQLREATMTTAFTVPPDDQWDERPRGNASRLSFGLGWTFLLVWLVGVAGFALGALWSGPYSLIEKLLVFGGLTGIALLFLSALMDRLKNLGRDRYRRIDK